MEATIHTNMGDIRLELFPEQAPNTVKNFTSLAKGEREWTDPSTGQQTSRPLYDGTIFHRVIDGFMIQGGDPLGTGTGGPGYQFNDEIHPDLNFDKPYLLAMANAGKRIDDESKRVVDAIATTRTGRGDRPVEDVVISSIDIVD